MKAGEVAFLALAGLIVFACTVLWLWGAAAGLLWGGGLPELSLADQLDVLKRLPENLSDPAQAWPVHARSELPDATKFYATLALTMPVSSGVLALAVVAFLGLRKV